MNFVFKMMNSVSKATNCVSKTRTCVSKTRNCVSIMTNFAAGVSEGAVNLEAHIELNDLQQLASELLDRGVGIVLITLGGAIPGPL